MVQRNVRYGAPCPTYHARASDSEHRRRRGAVVEAEVPQAVEAHPGRAQHEDALPAEPGVLAGAPAPESQTELVRSAKTIHWRGGTSTSTGSQDPAELVGVEEHHQRGNRAGVALVSEVTLRKSSSDEGCSRCRSPSSYRAATASSANPAARPRTPPLRPGRLRTGARHQRVQRQESLLRRRGGGPDTEVLVGAEGVHRRRLGDAGACHEHARTPTPRRAPPAFPPFTKRTSDMATSPTCVMCREHGTAAGVWGTRSRCAATSDGFRVPPVAARAS